MSVILHPAARKPDTSDFHGASKQSVSRFLQYLQPPEQELLKREFPNDTLYARGATEAVNGSNRTQWNKIEAGDSALFFRENKLIGSGEVVLKLESTTLTEELGWGEDDETHLPFRLVYVVKGIKPLNASQDRFFQRIYGKPIQQFGLRVLQGMKAEKALEWLQGEEDVSDAEYAAIVDVPPQLTSTDREIRTRARKEQAYWRKFLFKNSDFGTCGICGGVYPKDFLRAAHIKRRSHCGHEERLDPNNIIAACLFGCDALFEDGIIVVRDGRVQINFGEPTGALKSKLQALEGRQCPFWNNKSAKYFQSHEAAAGIED